MDRFDGFIGKLKSASDWSKIRVCVQFQDGTVYRGKVLMSGTLTDQFDAAVRIIHGLPKDGNGTFHPSNEMKLKFYALYKQAKFGKCNTSKPSFWDLINRAKWDAWNSLGEMSTETAMTQYVDEIKQIIETMPLDGKVEDFMASMGPLYEFVELDKKGPEVVKPGKHEVSKNSKSTPNGHLVNGHAGTSNGHHETTTESIDVVLAKIANGKVNGEPSNNDEQLTDVQMNGLDSVAFSTKPPKSSIKKTADDSSPSDSANISDLSTDSRNSGRNRENVVGESKETEKQTSAKVSTKSDLEEDDGDEEEELVYADASDKPLTQVPLTVSVPVQAELPSTSADRSVRKSRHSSSSRPKRRHTSGVNNGNASNHSPIESPSSVYPIPDDDQLGRLYDESWNAVERLQVEKQIRHHQRSQWNGILKPHRKSSARRARGAAPADGAPKQSTTPNGADQAPVPPNQRAGNGTTRGGRHNRDLVLVGSDGSDRTLSGSNPTSMSESSTGDDDSSDMTWDPHVAAVLFKMHRELRQMNRQLELIENSLIAQHQLIRHVIQQQNSQRSGLGALLPSGLTWRTVAFFLAWPIIVHFLLKFSYRRMFRRRFNF